MYYIYYMFNIVSWFLIGWFDSSSAIDAQFQYNISQREIEGSFYRQYL